MEVLNLNTELNEIREEMENVKVITKKQAEEHYSKEVEKHKLANSKLKETFQEFSKKFSVIRSELVNKKSEITALQEKNKFYKNKLDVNSVIQSIDKITTNNSTGDSNFQKLKNKYN